MQVGILKRVDEALGAHQSGESQRVVLYITQLCISDSYLDVLLLKLAVESNLRQLTKYILSVWKGVDGEVDEPQVLVHHCDLELLHVDATKLLLLDLALKDLELENFVDLILSYLM